MKPMEWFFSGLLATLELLAKAQCTMMKLPS